MDDSGLKRASFFDLEFFEGLDQAWQKVFRKLSLPDQRRAEAPELCWHGAASRHLFF